MTFNAALLRFRTIIMNQATGTGFVSAVDLAGKVPSVTRSRRGAVVKRAFAGLVSEGCLTKTQETAYNKATHHQVAVYAVG